MQRRVTFYGFSRLAFFACAVAVAAPNVDRASAADANVLQGLYHEGVKSFYAGDYNRAADILTTAVDAGTKDPRSFYYRGLSLSRLGRRTEADADFKRGAEIEGRDFDAFFNVSRSIERIQGSERLMLERYRVKGRQNALAELENIRYQRFRRFQPGGATPPLTAEGGSAPAATPTDAGAPATTPGTAPANPFAPSGTTPAAPATPAAPTNPFGGSATPAAAPSGAPAAAPSGAAPANPFGT